MNREKIQKALDQMIPPHMHGGILRYLFDGIEPGSFLTAVFENDLKGAVVQADAINAAALVNYGKFLIWHMPMSSVGSREAVQKWCAHGGLYGMAQK